MPSVTTRSITNSKDTVAVKVEAGTYKDKWGILEVVVDNITYTTGSGTVDIRVCYGYGHQAADLLAFLRRFVLRSEVGHGSVGLQGLLQCERH